MKKHIISLKFLALLLTICFIPTVAISFELITRTETIVVDEVKIELKKTADNFIILYDSSSSMGDIYKKTGKKKIELEREIFKTRAGLIPNLKYNAGIYSLSPKALKISGKVLKPFYKMQPYNKAAFGKAIDTLPIKSSGQTLLQQGLVELDGLLEGLSGHTVVFIATDSEFTEMEGMDRPIDIARGLARKYDVAFQLIDSSGNKSDKPLRQIVASINARSQVITFDQFLENPFLLTGALFVLDARIVQKSIDIEKVIGARLSGALFAFDSAEINEKYAAPLEKLGKYMQSNPKARLALSAFTDNRGSVEYNLRLSRHRAESIGTYLETKFNIAPERLVLNYYGEAYPVASNDTAEGRKRNRRVEGFIFGL
jgi:OOP family OmpA-OmpF porin